MKLICLALLLMGCGSARRGLAVVGPISLSGEQVHGERLFVRHCNACHPGGEGGLGPALNDKPMPELLVKTQVRLGLGAMPSFDRAEISSEDLDAITGYLSALRRGGRS